MEESHATHHGPGMKLITGIWIILLILTGVTVAVARFDFGYLNVVVALVVATTKATLVAAIFMHLKYESGLFQGFVILAFAILAIFIGFTFFDTAYR